MKKFFLGIGIAIVALVAIVVIAVSMIDTDSVKALLVEQVKEHTGRELIIDGDLSWRFFPYLGFSIEQVQLKDHPEFSDMNTLSLRAAGASVAILPLFSKTIELGDIHVSGLSLRHETNAQGMTNVDDLLKTDTSNSEKDSNTESSSSASESTGKPMADWTIVLSGLALEEAKISLIDRQQKTEQEIGPITFILDSLDFDKPNRFELRSAYTAEDLSIEQQASGILLIAEGLERIAITDFVNDVELVGSSIPNGKMEIHNKLALVFELAKQHLELTTLNTVIDDEIEILGNAAISLGGIPNITYHFSIPLLDLNHFITQDTSKQTVAAEPSDSEQSTATEQEPDLSALKTVNAKGDIKIGQLKVNNIHVEDIVMKQKLKNGRLSIDELSANLYQGKLLSTASLDATKSIASYSFNSTLSNVAALPLLKDVADLAVIDGNLNADLSLKGKGLTPTNLKKNISGPVNASFLDGAIYGVNIPQMIRKATAALKGGDSQTAKEEQKTDFSELNLAANLGNAQANVSTAQLLSPLIRIDGKGHTHLLKESLDFSFVTKVVASLEGQGSSNDLDGLNIPLEIKGTWTEPKVGLDMDALMKSEAKKVAEKELKKVLGDDNSKLLDSVGSLFK